MDTLTCTVKFYDAAKIWLTDERILYRTLRVTTSLSGPDLFDLTFSQKCVKL
jgi:hypothetical protein